MKKKYLSLPLLPLRDVVIYPNMVVPLFVGRDLSIKSLDESMNNHHKNIVLVTQKSAQIDDPDTNDLYKIGTEANILQLLKLPDGTMKVLVEGVSRVEINKIENNSILTCTYSHLDSENLDNDNQHDALFRTLEDTFSNYVKLNKKVPPEVISSVTGIDDLSKLADSIAAHMTLKLDEKQQVLELVGIKKRCEYLIKAMEGELDILHVEKKIRSRVKQQMEKSQREYYLNEQMKAIQKELGEIGDDNNDIDQLLNKIKSLKLPSEAHEKAMSEFNKLKMMSPMSAEATVVRNYLDILVSLPWNQSTEISTDMV
ncbi:MAG: LON peptidase substrate-binding domain-containing protein, partial [Gammaproteobacteria bacterium]